MRSTRIGRPTRAKYPYRSLICQMMDTAYRDALDGEDVDWAEIPWREHVDVPVASLKRSARHARN